jgi:hypothetical protein
VSGRKLRHGHTRSCGCLVVDSMKAVSTKHGKTKTPEFRSWKSMLSRCSTTATNKGTKHYAARGIKVCDRWMDCFENFLEDMGPKPTPRHSLDRIDVNGNYEPSNCRWATWTEQARNKRNVIYVTINGVTKARADWLEEAWSLLVAAESARL